MRRSTARRGGVPPSRRPRGGRGARPPARRRGRRRSGRGLSSGARAPPRPPTPTEKPARDRWRGPPTARRKARAGRPRPPPRTGPFNDPPSAPEERAKPPTSRIRQRAWKEDDGTPARLGTRRQHRAESVLIRPARAPRADPPAPIHEEPDHLSHP